MDLLDHVSPAPEEDVPNPGRAFIDKDVSNHVSPAPEEDVPNPGPAFVEEDVSNHVSPAPEEDVPNPGPAFVEEDVSNHMSPAPLDEDLSNLVIDEVVSNQGVSNQVSPEPLDENVPALRPAVDAACQWTEQDQQLSGPNNSSNSDPPQKNESSTNCELKTCTFVPEDQCYVINSDDSEDEKTEESEEAIRRLWWNIGLYLGKCMEPSTRRMLYRPKTTLDWFSYGVEFGMWVEKLKEQQPLKSSREQTIHILDEAVNNGELHKSPRERAIDILQKAVENGELNAVYKREREVDSSESRKKRKQN